MYLCIALGICGLCDPINKIDSQKKHYRTIMFCMKQERQQHGGDNNCRGYPLIEIIEDYETKMELCFSLVS